MEKKNTLESIANLLLSQKRTLNVSELALLTGFSKSFIYKLTSGKQIPYSCPNGKLLVFDREKIEDWLLGNPISPTADVEQEAIDYIANKAWKGGRV